MKQKLEISLIVIQLLIAILCTANNINVHAQESIKMAIEPNEYIAKIIGETFNVTVNLYNLESIDRAISFQFRILYDENILEAVSVTEGSFIQQFSNAEEPPYTYFISYIEKSLIYGQNVIVGILLMPNATGSWTNFPYGNGSLATITFKAIKQSAEPEAPLSCALTLNETMVIDDSLNELPLTLQNGYYEIEPLSFTCEPETPRVGNPLFFSAPEATNSMKYCWSFGDDTSLNVTDATVAHIFAAPGNYNATLYCVTDDLVTPTVTKTITVLQSNQPSIEVAIDVGSIHFTGEIAEFAILTSNYGETVNPTKIEAYLYYNGGLYANLTTSVQIVDKGFYRIPYSIPTSAQAGTYTLLVNAEYYNAKGIGMRSFLISSTLTSWSNSIAKITEINDGIAIIQSDLNVIKMNLTAINAKLVSVEGQIGIVNSTLGTLKTDIATLNVTLTNLIVNSKGEILANVTTTLGETNVKLGDVQSTATTTLYATSILSAIAVILAAAILIFMRKK